MKLLLYTVSFVHGVSSATQWVYPDKVSNPLCQKFERKGSSRWCSGDIPIQFDGPWPGSPANTDEYGCLDLEKPICPNDDTWALQWPATAKASKPFWAVETIEEDVCDAKSIIYNWQRKKYKYTCCKCPPGYFSSSTICSPRIPGEKCMRCTFRDWLVRNPKTRKLECMKYKTGAECKAAEWVLFMIIKKEDETSTLDKPVFHPEWFNGGEETGDAKHTIGYGHQCLVNNDCDKIIAPITEQQARKLLVDDVAAAERAVSGLPNIDQLTENQYGVLIDLGYNAGPNAPEAEFGQLMMEKRFDEIAEKLPQTRIWVKRKDGTSEILPGLVKRRTEMQKLWNTPSEKMSGCPRRIVYDPESSEPPPIPVLNDAGIPVFGEAGAPLSNAASDSSPGGAPLSMPNSWSHFSPMEANTGSSPTGSSNTFISLDEQILSFSLGDQEQYRSTEQWEIEQRAQELLKDIAKTWQYIEAGKDKPPQTSSVSAAHAEL